MKNLYKLLAILFFLSTINLFSQDESWVDIISEEAGLSDIRGFRVWIADVNNDDYPDLFWGGDNGGTKNHLFLYLNQPNPDPESDVERIFVDYTEESGIQQSRIDTIDSRIVDIAAMADLDNDGDIDLVTSIYTHRRQNYNSTGDNSEVMLNDGNGHFTLVDNNGLDIDWGGLSGKIPNTTSLSFLDYDLDGIIDLYVGTWFIEYPSSAPSLYMQNHLFKGNGDGTFSHQGPVGPREPLYGSNITDYNNDGWPDIVTSSYCRTGSALLRNDEGTFVNASQEANYNSQFMGGDHSQPLCQWEANPADFDNDGDMDLLETKVHGGYNSGEGRTTIAVNRGMENGYSYQWELDRIDRFAPDQSHLGDQGSTWFDLDNDGWQDIAIGQMAYPQANIYGQERLYVLRQNDRNYFDDISMDIGIFYNMKEAHSMEPIDFDNDGDLDLIFSRQHRDTVVVDGEEQRSRYNVIELMENKIGERNHFVQVKLNPIPNANASSIGAKIFVHTGEFVQKQEIQSGLGHFAGMQPFVKTFGIGEQETIDSIVVHWPNKSMDITTITDIPVNTKVTVNQIDMAEFDIMRMESEKLIAPAGTANIDFGEVYAGEIGQITQAIKNLSKDNGQITISEVYIEGETDFFTVDDSNLPITINNGEEVSFPLEFNPDTRRAYTGYLVVVNDSDNEKDLRIPIKGQGYEDKPIIALSSNEVEFEALWLDSTDTQSFQIRNTGELPLEITAADISENSDVFSFDFPMPNTISPGESIEFDISFTPNDKKEFTATVNLTTNAFNDTVNSFTLKGICDGPNTQIATNIGLFMNFGKIPRTETKTLPLTIINEGEFQLEVSGMEITEGDDAFKFDEEQFPLIIPTNEQKDVDITFEPVFAKKYSSELTIYNDSDNEPELVERLLAEAITGSNAEMWYAGEQLFKFDINPNPATNFAELSLEKFTEQQVPLTAYIADNTGNLVATVFNNRYFSGSERIQLDIAGLSSGMYHLVITDSRENTSVLKLVITK